MAFKWKQQKIELEQPGKGTIIARIEAEPVKVNGGPGVVLALGLIAMIAAFIFEDSAIRLAAWGAIWTGWNVLCGIGILNRRETNYIVYREPGAIT